MDSTTIVNLSQTRGDSKAYQFQRFNKSDKSVITTRPDSIYMTVKKNYDTKDYLFQKKIDDFVIDDDGTYHFEIEPKDTEDLRYGKYVYDIQVTTAGKVTTLVKGVFGIEKESTWAVNED